ncbi:methylthioribulose 1-phosphate dehydratase [bacterium]|nr:methylthioribulose 1-phosphate dehydratase [bacterium]
MTQKTSGPAIAPELRRSLGEALARISRRFYERGFADATSGNFSARVSSSPLAFIITSTGKDKAFLSPDDTVICDGSGAALPGEAQRPSYETLIHARTYAATGAGAVLHAHPPHAVALSTVVGDSIDLRGLELVKAFAGVKDPGSALALPVVDNDQDMERMSEACMKARRPGVPAVVLRGHGVTVWGQDLDEAVRHLEAVEGLSHIIFLKRSMGAH